MTEREYFAMLELTGARTPSLESRWNNCSLKRLMDIAGALAIGLFSLPAIFIIIVANWHAGGSLLYTQTRVGRGGRPFKIYKFRSMVPNAEQVLKQLIASSPEHRKQWEQDQKLKDDPRITPFGHFLRKTSLDELPQLINVLKGDMSLVGPRPAMMDQMSLYGRGSRFYVSLKPGLTGLWQVSGRADTDFVRRIAIDRKYFERSSFWLDVYILWQTIWVVVLRKGAY